VAVACVPCLYVEWYELGNCAVPADDEVGRCLDFRGYQIIYCRSHESGCSVVNDDVLYIVQRSAVLTTAVVINSVGQDLIITYYHDYLRLLNVDAVIFSAERPMT